ncbi:chalcone isomerase family protein [Idiomarina sp.]|uniref:chalcone isomerase family protein n=1 Tax=Idiomarina sp. TaxID=1874361 RepID=UPI0025C63CCE|nr:chalcone isomerase family protein [Idiomarina sp.]MCJ8316041.1 chalcone isomerase family protein [Idiomarina sp.]
MRKFMLAASALLVSALSTPAFAASCEASVPGDFSKVGETRLSVLFWDVYDATLYSPSGEYEKSERQALNLNYLRDIDADDLIETTEEEWQKLKLDSSEHEGWLAKLKDIWPNIKKGDCLLLVESDNGYAEFYQGEELLGTVESQVFTDQFLAIWLSPESRFEDERNELVGAK